MRCKYGFSDEDLWSFDWYLIGIIQQGLARLKKEAIGYPSDLTSKKWDKTLDEIIDGFKSAEIITKRSLIEIDKDGCLHFNEKGYKEHMKKFNKGMDLFKKYFFSLWD